MNKQTAKRYLSFVATFLVMHCAGKALMNLPYVFNAVVVFVAVLFTILFFNILVYGKTIGTSISDIGLRKTNLSGLVPGIFVSAALLFAYPLLGILLNTNITLADGWQWNTIGLMFTAGLAEEVLFRGYLFGGLRREMSFRKAAIISTIWFAIAHLIMFTYMDWPVAMLSTLLAVATSIPLAFLFEKGNNTLWSPAIVHTAIRTVGLVATTDGKYFMRFSMLWIIVCMVLPYIILICYKEFRKIWV